MAITPHIIELRTGKKSEPGNFVDKSGSILGRHNGIIRYTIGQHRGLGLSLSQKYYVCEICPADNTVVLGESADLFHRGVQVQDMHWIARQRAGNGLPLQGKAPLPPPRAAGLRHRAGRRQRCS